MDSGKRTFRDGGGWRLGGEEKWQIYRLVEEQLIY